MEKLLPLLLATLLLISTGGCLEEVTKSLPSDLPTDEPPAPSPTPTSTPTPKSQTEPTTPSPTVETTPTPTPREQGATFDRTIPGETGDGNSIQRNFSWNHSGRTWTWNISIPRSSYEYYLERPRVKRIEKYGAYVVDPYDDEYLDGLTSKIEEAGEQEGMTSQEEVDLAVSFVQGMEYTLDNVTAEFDEYPRYPLETLVERGGDCEDTSILLASMLREMGYDVVLVELPGHMGVGVAGEGFSGSHYDRDGKRYYYVETTGEGWTVGKIPEAYRSDSARLYTLQPEPILTHRVENFTLVDRKAKFEVNVDNVGGSTAQGVRTRITFDRRGTGHFDRKSSDPLDLDPGSIGRYRLFMEPPIDRETRISVEIVNDTVLFDNYTTPWGTYFYTK